MLARWGRLLDACRSFCDLIAFEAADLDAFLLDPTYAALLDPDEEQLAARLRPLMDVSSTSVSGEATLPAVARVERLLEELGARRTPG